MTLPMGHGVLGLPPWTPGARDIRALGLRCARTVMVAGILALTHGVAHAQWTAELTVERFRWREHTSPIEVREDGPRFALGAAYAQPRSRGLLLAGYLRVLAGAVGYEGSLQASPSVPAQSTAKYLGASQGLELRQRWPALDLMAGMEFNQWRRRFSAYQTEHFRILSARFGAERLPSRSLPILVGGGVRMMVRASEQAISTNPALTYDVTLEPGPAAHPFAQLGGRVAPGLTVVATWDGLRMERSDPVRITQPAGSVAQPRTDMDTFGLRVVYQLGPSVSP